MITMPKKIGEMFGLFGLFGVVDLVQSLCFEETSTTYGHIQLYVDQIEQGCPDSPTISERHGPSS